MSRTARILFGLVVALVLGAGLLLWHFSRSDIIGTDTVVESEAIIDPPPGGPTLPDEEIHPDSLSAALDTFDLTADTTNLSSPDPAAPPAPNMPLPSGLIIPVAGVEPDDLTDTFEEGRSQNRLHDAIDIMAPRGTPVLAAADGRIVRLFTSEHGGITIYQLAPDDRTVYYYAHLDRYADGLADGDTVRQGDVIGYVGDTGNAVPGNYHLHFAIWITDDPEDFWEGQPVNPYPLLQH